MVLTLSKEEMAKHGITKLNFTPAKFDASTSIVVRARHDLTHSLCVCVCPSF